MAQVKTKSKSPDPSKRHRRTSIGHSVNTRPRNKHKRRSFKAYRGQG